MKKQALTSLLALALALPSIAATPKSATGTSTRKATAADAKKPTPDTTPHTIIADVDGIVCAFCVQGIQKIFQKKGKTEEVLISLELKKVFVKEKTGQSITDDEFRETIRQAGFKTQAITRSPLSIAEAKTRLTNKEPLVTTAPRTKPVQTAQTVSR
ncbi:MAG: hypothetical protein JNM99_14210 [Verrucomicrobiaceae bacterium]|nr:hypothetical protein [Verrucomicrobiaceae bacterium]